MSHVPPASYNAASIVVPLFYEKLAPDKRSTGKIEPPANRECSPFRIPSTHGAHYAPVITIRPLPVLSPSFFFLYIDTTENADGELEGSRRTRQENRTGAVCFLFPLPSLRLFPFLHVSSIRSRLD